MSPRWRGPGAIFLLAFCACAPAADSPKREVTTIRFWAMGREGEVVAELVPAFEAEHPGIRVLVQQVPWSAAHEKLVTSFVGGATPDISQLGNTWVSEFAALGALEPLDSWVSQSKALAPDSFFSGVWETNVIDRELFGIPWYVDTRVLFYCKDILAQAGYEKMPESWAEWRTCLEAVKRVVGPDRYAIFLPLNEWMPPVVLAMQSGSPILRDEETRGAFRQAEFQGAFRWYVDLFEEGLAPSVRNSEIANMYQEFERGTFSMLISGPWNVGEFRRRLPADMQDSWSTAPLPSPDEHYPGVSFAGGSSLVIYKNSKHRQEAWLFLEYLLDPETQVKFAALTGDLPARVESWEDSTFTSDEKILAFRRQLDRVVPTPKIPEWEQIATRIQDRVEFAVREKASLEEATRLLDEEVDRLLEKRRWLLTRRGKLSPKSSPDGGPS